MDGTLDRERTKIERMVITKKNIFELQNQFEETLLNQIGLRQNLQKSFARNFRPKMNAQFTIIYYNNLNVLRLLKYFT